LKLVFAGTPATAARTLQALLAGPHQVVAVLTRTDAPVGRKRVLTPSPTAQVAEAASIPVIKANRVDEAVAAQIKATGAELGIIVAYGALLKKFALEALPLGWANLHYSLLPKWRGAAPVQNSILAGDADTGVTMFKLDEGMDTGPIYGVVPTVIQPGETSGRLLERLTELGITLMNQVLPELEAGLAKPTPQVANPDLLLAAKPTRELAAIDWNRSARELERLILAMNPEPMAHTRIGEDSFRILDAASLGRDEGETTPGALRLEPKRVLVECGEGTLLLLKTVQPAGKNPMPALDWARGAAGKVSHLG
jgi:methionyl-tRNA formyltransferase